MLGCFHLFLLLPLSFLPFLSQILHPSFQRWALTWKWPQGTVMSWSPPSPDRNMPHTWREPSLRKRERKKGRQATTRCPGLDQGREVSRHMYGEWPPHSCKCLLVAECLSARQTCEYVYLLYSKWWIHDVTMWIEYYFKNITEVLQ